VLMQYQTNPPAAETPFSKDQVYAPLLLVMLLLPPLDTILIIRIKSIADAEQVQVGMREVGA
jgi:hypothetical protein